MTSRWQAFAALRQRERAHDPPPIQRHVEAPAVRLARQVIPLAVLDDGGTLYVRSDWLCAYARRVDPHVGNNQRITVLMSRIGWTSRRGRKIRARDPKKAEPDIYWAFLIVPEGWDS